jgi:hypothetical protein
MTFQIYTKVSFPKPPSRQTLNAKRETETKTATSAEMKLDKRSKNAAENCKTIKELQIQIAVFSFKEKLTLKNRHICKDGTR